VLHPQDLARPFNWDFGRVPYGETRKLVVQLKNAEGKELTIQSVTAGCSCTQPRLSYVNEQGREVLGDMRSSASVLTLPPGQVADLALELNSRGVPAHNQRKLVNVMLVTDSARNPFQRFELHVEVVLPFQVAPAILQLGEIASSAGAHGETTISQLGTGGERVVGVLSAPAELEVALLPQPPALGREVWKLSVQWLPPVPEGNQTRKIELRTTGEHGEGEGRPLEVGVTLLGIPDIVCLPARLYFDTAQTPYVSEIELWCRVPGQRIRVADQRVEGSSSEQLRCVCTAVDPDERGRSVRWRIRLHADPALGVTPLTGKVTLVLDDPQVPEVVIPFVRVAKS
jgi:uncharacterized protein DUF1573